MNSQKDSRMNREFPQLQTHSWHHLGFFLLWYRGPSKAVGSQEGPGFALQQHMMQSHSYQYMMPMMMWGSYPVRYPKHSSQANLEIILDYCTELFIRATQVPSHKSTTLHAYRGCLQWCGRCSSGPWLVGRGSRFHWAESLPWRVCECSCCCQGPPGSHRTQSKPVPVVAP